MPFCHPLYMPMESKRSPPLPAMVSLKYSARSRNQGFKLVSRPSAVAE